MNMDISTIVFFILAVIAGFIVIKILTAPLRWIFKILINGAIIVGIYYAVRYLLAMAGLG